MTTATVIRDRKILGKLRVSGDTLTEEEIKRIPSSSMKAMIDGGIARYEGQATDELVSNFKIQELETRIVALETKLAEPQVESPKRRRGRPRKEEVQPEII